jgi:hypothetical protein
MGKKTKYQVFKEYAELIARDFNIPFHETALYMQSQGVRIVTRKMVSRYVHRLAHEMKALSIAKNLNGFRIIF